VARNPRLVAEPLREVNAARGIFELQFFLVLGFCPVNVLYVSLIDEFFSEIDWWLDHHA
jgi:hypothetical protein